MRTPGNFELDEWASGGDWINPRERKLEEKQKYYVVVAIDEPYFCEVYAMIRSHEIAKGRWSSVDEQIWLNATDGRYHGDGRNP